MEIKDLTGKRFGLLTVIQRADTQKNGTYWLCKCECGNTTEVRRDHLETGNIKSCGCMQRKYGHGQTETRLYHIWCTMKARCFTKTSHKYTRYGGRGITMCEEWKNDFAQFYDWSIEHGYQDNLSIDRIDNNGNYCPDNCRWVTPTEQSNNTSKNVLIEYKGETGTLSQMARKYGLKPTVVSKRLKRGWSIKRTLETPIITTFIGSSGL